MKICFIPGLGPDPEFYQPLLAALPGLELVPTPNFTYQEAEDFLNALTDKEEQLLLCGWSLGSLFALRWTLDHPASVAALFLTGATARFCSREGYANGVQVRTLKLMRRQAQRNFLPVLQNFYASAFALLPDREAEIIRLLEHPPAQSAFLKGLEELASTDLLEALGGLTLPVEIVQGREDPITPPAGARVVAATIPGCRLVELPGGHCLFREQPQLLAGLLAGFIERNSHAC